MRQVNILTVIVLVSVLGLAACDSRSATTSVLPTPVSIIPTATSLPISTTAAPTVTETPTQISTETPAAPTATLCPTSAPGRLIGQILFLAAKCDSMGVCPHPSTIYRIRSDGSGLQQVFQSQADIFDLALSPDGTKLAFTEDYGWGYQVHILDLETGDAQPLVDLPYSTRMPRWVSNDQLLCVARPTVSGGTNNIYVAGVDGGEWQQLTNYLSTNAFFDLAVSPDGAQCLFAKYDSDADRTTVSRMNTDRTGLQELISFPGHHPVDVVWSPSGRWMAIYPTGSTDLIPIYLANREGADTVEIAQLADSPQLLAWATDESELIFLQIRSRSVVAVRRDGNGTRMIARVSDPGELAMVSDLYLSPVALSTDQAQLVFSPLGGGLYVMDMHTGCWQQLMSGYLAFSILWVP